MGIAIALESQRGLVDEPGLAFRFTTVVTLVTGTMFLMWLGEQITERGIGNGIFTDYFAGMLRGFRGDRGTLELARTGAYDTAGAVAAGGAILVTGFVVFGTRQRKKILVNYAKRRWPQVYGGQSFAPAVETEHVGGHSPIFASSINLFPATLAGWFGSTRA